MADSDDGGCCGCVIVILVGILLFGAFSDEDGGIELDVKQETGDSSGIDVQREKEGNKNVIRIRIRSEKTEETGSIIDDVIEAKTAKAKEEILEDALATEEGRKQLAEDMVRDIIPNEREPEPEPKITPHRNKWSRSRDDPYASSR